MDEGASFERTPNLVEAARFRGGRLAYGPTQNPKKTSKGASWSKP